MKRTLQFILTIFGMATLSFGGTAGPGNISSILYMSNGTVIFTLSGSRANPPTCTPSYYQNMWAIEANTSAGKARLSGLLTAYSTGTKITITGTGTCSYWGDRESVDFFQTVE